MISKGSGSAVFVRVWVPYTSNRFISINGSKYYLTDSSWGFIWPSGSLHLLRLASRKVEGCSYQHTNVHTPSQGLVRGSPSNPNIKNTNEKITQKKILFLTPLAAGRGCESQRVAPGKVNLKDRFS